MMPNRREMLTMAGGLTLAAGSQAAAQGPARELRIGVISSSVDGKAQINNGHTWHFAQYFHPEINMAAIRKFLDPGSARGFERYLRNPRYSFDQLPFPDTRITHVYSNPADGLDRYIEAFPGVRIAKSLDELVDAVDAVWLGDANSQGNDHFELIAPALRKGLPCFVDKPIGGSIAETKKIIDLAKQHKAPLMSASIFRYQFGMEQALRLRDANEFGPLQFVLASMAGGYSARGWFIYGHHPIWSVITLCGAGVEGVSMITQQNTAHAFITYKDKMPAEVWYGRPDIVGQYNHITAYFAKKAYSWTPAIEGDFQYGHHYEMFRMAHTFREMIRTKREPVPHEEILEVTAIIHAAAKSLEEKKRLVTLAEVLPKG